MCPLEASVRVALDEQVGLRTRYGRQAILMNWNLWRPACRTRRVPPFAISQVSSPPPLVIQGPEARFRVPEARFRVPETGFRVPGTGFRPPETGFRPPETKFRLLETGFRLLKTRFRLLETGF